MRSIATYSSLGFILFLIGYLFYIQEIKYWIPTPIPQGFEHVALGSKVHLKSFNSPGKKFIHFYNPNCPCSKFNTRSYKDLLRKYRDKFDSKW